MSISSLPGEAPPRPGDILADFERLSLAEQCDLFPRLQAAHARKITERKRELEAELRRLAEMETGTSAPYSAKGIKLPIKYRSKRDPTKAWSGRGEHPRWLREEMATLKKPLEFFSVSEDASD